MRPVEVANLALRDTDLENGIVSVYTAKHGKSGIIKLEPYVEAILKEHIRKNKFELDDGMFPSNEMISNTFERLRTALAKTLRRFDPMIYLASMQHALSSNKRYSLVKEYLGHKSINDTLIYTHLIDFNDSEQRTCKVAQNIEEGSKLIESGFDYVATLKARCFSQRGNNSAAISENPEA